MVWLAEYYKKPQTTDQIASGMEVPAGYLSKVLQILGRGGFVSSQRGIGGGFILAKDPEKISVLEIINSVDPIQRIRECPLGHKKHGKKLCPLHYRLDAALALIEDSFRTCTIKDLCSDPEGRPTVCPKEGE